MVLLIHSEGKFVIQVIRNGVPVRVESESSTSALWELAEKFPKEVIGWCESNFSDLIKKENWNQIFHHDLIMASYGIENQFLPEAIGYIDEMPFINIEREVSYGTWRMSSDVGGIKGETLLKFQPIFGKIKNLDYLLNAVAKLGQQNSLFCYSSPSLIKEEAKNRNIKPTGSFYTLFSFVHQFYSNYRSILLFWCIFMYDKGFPVLPFIRGFFFKKLNKRSVDLKNLKVNSINNTELENIDVIIPTIGRAIYLHHVLKDFARQTHLPRQIIIVEQNPDPDAASELDFIINEIWPFKIIHHLTTRIGVCFARNLALSFTTSEWIFLSDDDQRFHPDLIEKIFQEINKYGLDGLTTSYLQKGEKQQFQVPKQWGTFGAGNSVIKKIYTDQVAFSVALEHGYGEDKDYGMQLRKVGCDIIYHPQLKIQHLKAPIGGFRYKVIPEWEMEKVKPKPSPTLMVYMKNHYTQEQIKGFKNTLFLKFYLLQKDKNPVTYLREMNKRWNTSNEWANKLLQSMKS